MMSDMPDRIFVDGEGGGTDWWTNNHLREANPDEVVIRYAWTEEYVRAGLYADLERQRDEMAELLKDVDVSHDNNGTDWLYSCRRSEDEWIVARDEALAKAEKADE